MRTIVHEIRNQLAVATATVEAFLDGKIEPTEKRLRSVLQALDSIDTLLDSLPPTELAMPTNLGKKQELQPINICEIIDLTVEGIRAKVAGKNIDLQHEICLNVDQHCEAFIADPVRIAQILNNLFLNAIAYTPEGGSITISCHRELGGIEVRIEDTGYGITDEDLEHLFESGFRGSSATGVSGSGLGLPIVKRLLEEQGGSISVQRRTNGTAFTVSLTDKTDICKACHVSH